MHTRLFIIIAICCLGGIISTARADCASPRLNDGGKPGCSVELGGCHAYNDFFFPNAGTAVELLEYQIDTTFLRLQADREAGRAIELRECLEYLESSVDKECADVVSDWICEYYLNSIGTASDKAVFDIAMKYAKSEKHRQMVQDARARWQAGCRMRKKDLAKKNLFNPGIGLEYEMLDNMAAGVKAECRFGAHWQTVNATAGYRLMFFNYGCSGVFHRDYVSWLQNSFYAGMRINLNKTGFARFHIDGEAAYNITGGCRYHHGKDYISDKELGRNFFSATARTGALVGNFDIALHFRYDLKPAIDQKYIYESREYDYRLFGKAVNERWRIGISLIYYIWY